MKAIYEVTFGMKGEPEKVSDLRRICRDATTTGFKNVLAWAVDCCGKDETVTAIRVLASERP